MSDHTHQNFTDCEHDETMRTPTKDVNATRQDTPQYGSTPCGTIKPYVKNPFDKPLEMLKRLQSTSDSPFVSPGFLKTPEKNSKAEAFAWTIDELAILKPVAFDERPVQQDTLNIIDDPEVETELQNAITHYFKTRSIAPSPMHEPPPKHFLPQTPGRENMSFEEMVAFGSPNSENCGSPLYRKTEPIEPMLTPNNKESKSKQSFDLRRKLFEKGDKESDYSKFEKHGEFEDSAAVCASSPYSPTNRLHPGFSPGTPPSLKFSSSPIAGTGSMARFRKRMSHAQSSLAIESPNISPIKSFSKEGGKTLFRPGPSRSHTGQDIPYDTGYSTLQGSHMSGMTFDHGQSVHTTESVWKLPEILSSDTRQGLIQEESMMDVSYEMSSNNTVNME